MKGRRERWMILAVAALLFAGRALASGVETNGWIEGRLETSAEKLPTCLSRFLSYPPDRGKLEFPNCLKENPFPENPDFWLKGVDFTCVSPWNDSYGRFRAGTAISKRHIIFAKHFPMAVGTRIAFVGRYGDTSHYTIKATKALEKCDIMIGLLDYELTPDVQPAKVLPRGFEQRLPLGSKWPVVTFNQHEQVFLSEATCRSNAWSKVVSPSNSMCTREEEKKFGGAIIVGDSGDPAFLLYGGRPILLYCLFSGGVGHGPMVHEFRNEVQGAMDDLCSGYKLEAFEW